MKNTKLLALLPAFALVVSIMAGCHKSQPVTQEIIIGDQFDLGSFDPASGMLDDTQILVYDSLIELDADFNQTPGLAESWKMSEDGKTWTFNLRKGVTFHDGETFNAAAVLTNFQGRLDGGSAASSVEYYETPDDYTLICHLASPSYTFSSDIARTTMSIASPKAINEDGSLAYEAGTGPYTLIDWSPDVEYVFEAYDGYWGGDVNIRKITFKVITDAQARSYALESGEIDMMSGYQSLAAVQRLQGDPNFTVFRKTQNTSAAIFFNLERVPDLAVRTAIAQAIDFDTMIPSLLSDLASPPSGFFSPAYGKNVSPDAKNPAYDPEAAKIALDGKNISLSLTYSTGNSEDSLLAPMIQSYLAEAGVDLTLNGVDGATLGDLLKTKDYDMVLAGQSFIPTDDTTFNYARGYWHSGSYYNIYSTPEIDTLIDTLKTSMDSEERRNLNWQIQERIMEQVPVIMAYHRNSIRLADANISNFDIGAGCWHVNYNLKNAIVGE